MEIETAVEWLNRVKHGEFADWYADNEGLIRTQTGWLSYWERDALIIAQWYAERAPGTWLWALEQMEAGRRVRLPEWLNNSIYIVADFLRWSVSPATMKVEWFSRTNWQLAEEQP